MTAFGLQAASEIPLALLSAVGDKGELNTFQFIWSLVEQMGWVVRMIVLLLVIFSVISWGIIFFKGWMMKQASRQSIGFLDMFWRTKRLDKIYDTSAQYSNSPIAEVFKAGYVELTKIRRSWEQDEKENKKIHKEEDLDSIERALRRAHTSQITKLESTVGFLATTGSSSPFIGLFGTVWGIMISFHEIHVMGDASLQTVAPGISEALIATAIGLVAAIPAVMAYNYFVGRIKVIDAEMENFSRDFLNIVKRHFFR